MRFEPMRSVCLSCLTAATLLLSPLRLSFGQGEHDHAGEKLGTVVFATSCEAAAQPEMNRAVALMHSFQFASAIQALHAVLATDPGCAMADWGIALSDWGNPFAAGLKSEGQMQAGLAAVEQARALHPRTPRESAYIEAVAQLYGKTASEDQRARKLGYESAMAAVSAAYPADDEAAIFSALAIAAAADPADKTYARQLKAGAILERLYAQYPDHPGLAHYIIHTYDVPPLAARAAGAAQHYSDIAPSTPHALHMPSHTFTRVGDWQASIDGNVASAKSARRAGQPADELHASDYLVYAYLQRAQDRSAGVVAEGAPGMFARFDPKMQVGGAGGPTAAYFARAAIPARYALERRDWAGAAKLEVLTSPFPYTEAMTYFARGLGAAHLKDVAGAHAALDSLGQCHERLVAMKEVYWANQVEIERQELSAWIAFSQGEIESGLSEMRAAAGREDGTEKSAVTPGPLAPARELLGEMLLELKRPAEARKEFELTLAKEPNRFWSLYGAAEAAKLAGDGKAAQNYFARLLQVAGGADRPERREMVEARAESRPS